MFNYPWLRVAHFSAHFFLPLTELRGETSMPFILYYSVKVFASLEQYGAQGGFAA